VHECGCQHVHVHDCAYVLGAAHLACFPSAESMALWQARGLPIIDASLTLDTVDLLPTRLGGMPIIRNSVPSCRLIAVLCLAALCAVGLGVLYSTMILFELGDLMNAAVPSPSVKKATGKAHPCKYFEYTKEGGGVFEEGFSEQCGKTKGKKKEESLAARYQMVAQTIEELEEAQKKGEKKKEKKKKPTENKPEKTEGPKKKKKEKKTLEEIGTAHPELLERPVKKEERPADQVKRKKVMQYDKKAAAKWARASSNSSKARKKASASTAEGEAAKAERETAAPQRIIPKLEAVPAAASSDWTSQHISSQRRLGDASPTEAAPIRHNSPSGRMLPPEKIKKKANKRDKKQAGKNMKQAEKDKKKAEAKAHKVEKKNKIAGQNATAGLESWVLADHQNRGMR